MKVALLGMMMSLAVVGCGGDGAGNGGGGPPDMALPPVPHNFAQIRQQVLLPSCTFSVCHSTHGAPNAGMLDFTNDPWGAMVGQAATNKQAVHEGLMRIKPCDPAASFVYVKLTLPESQTDSMQGYGSHMPQSNSMLPATQLQGIHDWIARGAKSDEPDDASGTTCVLTH